MTEVLLAVLAGSVLGSLHCVGMCGAFVAVVSGGEDRAWAAQLSYHAGRGITYVSLGALAGSLGSALNLAGLGAGLGEVAAVVAGGSIILWGSLQLRAVLRPALVQAGARRTGPLLRLWQHVLVRLNAQPPLVRGLVLGLSSTLLPCGWLYGFVLTAAGTGHPLRGALVMAAFWMGTVPALLGLGVGVGSIARWLRPRLGWLMPAALVLLGLVTIAQRESFARVSFAAPSASTQVAPCH